MEKKVVGKLSFLVLDADKADCQEDCRDEQTPESLPIASPPVCCISPIGTSYGIWNHVTDPFVRDLGISFIS